MRETTIERYLRTKMKGIGGDAMKWVCPGRVGVPDRIVAYQGRVVFVEVKRPTGLLREVQARTIRYLKDMGCEATMVSTREQVDELVQKIINGEALD